MPKVRPPKQDPRETKILAEIGATLATMKISQKELARRCGINPSTFSLRMKDIRTLRLWELWAIQDARKKSGVEL